MAIDPGNFDLVTREMLHGWLQDWEALPSRRPAKKGYLKQRMDEVQPGLGDELVNVGQRSDIKGDTVPLIDLVMADIDSYG